MPTLPLYTPNPAHPDASREVIAPGGYERWHFDAESDDGTLLLVASFFRGSLDHPDYDRYLRHYDRYRRRPTRVPPPAPADYAGVSLALYEKGRALGQWVQRVQPDGFHASAERLEISTPNATLTTGPGGAVRVQGRQVPSGLTADLFFRPLESRTPVEISHGQSESVGAEHRWVVPAACAVDGTVSTGGGPGVVRFAGRGYRDQHFGTAPIHRSCARWRGRMFTDGGAIPFTLSRPADETSSEFLVVVMPDGQAHQAETDALFFGAEFPAELELKVVGLRLTTPRVIDRSKFRLRVLYDVVGPGAAGAAPRAALCEVARY